MQLRPQAPRTEKMRRPVGEDESKKAVPRVKVAKAAAAAVGPSQPSKEEAWAAAKWWAAARLTAARLAAARVAAARLAAARVSVRVTAREAARVAARVVPRAVIRAVTRAVVKGASEAKVDKAA